MLDSHEIEMGKRDVYRSNKNQNKNDQSSNYSKTIIKLFVEKIRQLIKISFAMIVFQRLKKKYEYLAANNGESLGEAVISASSKNYIKEKKDSKITKNNFEAD